MPQTVTLDVWVVVDEQGDYAVGTTDEHAAERYREEIGEPDAGTLGFRRVKVAVSVPLPEAVELAVSVPADEPPAVTTEAA